jgi:bromodomain adjacent to zinc finger domain protein 1A
MPLLKRQPFIPKEPPAGLKATDEVFYCKVTNEVFVDYQ